MNRVANIIERLKSHGEDSLFISEINAIRNCGATTDVLEQMITLIENEEEEKTKIMINYYDDHNKIVTALFYLVHRLIPNKFHWFYNHIEKYYNSKPR